METICCVEGCDRPGSTRGLCLGHLSRFYKFGDPGTSPLRARRPPPPECTVDGCGLKPRARGFCATHEARWRKHGDPGPAEFQHRGGICEVADCDNRSRRRGLCPKHYLRLRAHGDPTLIGHGNWRGDAVGYVGVHHRLREQRGKAAGYVCLVCGRQAADWAYDHEDPAELRDGGSGRPYSVHLNHYKPLCVSCHKRFDFHHRQERPA